MGRSRNAKWRARQQRILQLTRKGTAPAILEALRLFGLFKHHPRFQARAQWTPTERQRAAEIEQRRATRLHHPRGAHP